MTGGWAVVGVDVVELSGHSAGCLVSYIILGLVNHMNNSLKSAAVNSPSASNVHTNDIP